ncbi:GRAS family transcription factor [Euphorbia peplus]|nr:GRAS family transcription factor [Euphorbia peplus]
MKTELRPNTSLQKSSFLEPPQSSISGALKGCLGSLDGACIEKLLLHCASALESNDGTLAQQVMWVLNNVASVVGDPNQRLTSWFLRALISRASTGMMNLEGGSNTFQRRKMSVTQLAGYVDLIPWHRFGFCASNGAIFKAIEGYPKVHILDFSITHCMQWPTLIDALGKRPQGPPSLRITTLPSFRPSVPPFLNVSTEEIGLRLANFAKYREVPFEFKTIDIDASPTIEMLLNQLTPSALNLRDDEALVVNCQNWLRYLSDDTTSLRDDFLQIIKGLNPNIVVIVDEDSDLNGPCLSSRITTCFNYLWIPFDALETFLPRDSCQRMEYEADIGHKIENIISYEGFQRIERLESGTKVAQRMRNGGFGSVEFCEETIKEVKSLLDEHASGWGMKKEEEMLVLTWKGHNSVFATAWVLQHCLDHPQD